MIKVVRLNGEVLYLNYLQILYLESIPETKIKLVNGDFFIVKDSVESVIAQVNRLIGNILMFRDKEADEGKLSHFREVSDEVPGNVSLKEGKGGNLLHYGFI